MEDLHKNSKLLQILFWSEIRHRRKISTSSPRVGNISENKTLF